MEPCLWNFGNTGFRQFMTSFGIFFSRVKFQNVLEFFWTKKNRRNFGYVYVLRFSSAFSVFNYFLFENVFPQIPGGFNRGRKTFSREVKNVSVAKIFDLRKWACYPIWQFWGKYMVIWWPFVRIIRFGWFSHISN